MIAWDLWSTNHPILKAAPEEKNVIKSHTNMHYALYSQTRLVHVVSKTYKAAYSVNL